jgi:hypothetical protein
LQLPSTSLESSLALGSEVIFDVIVKLLYLFLYFL